MRIFNSEAGVRINGNYGTTPDMASVWFASSANSIGSYNNGGVYCYVNLSSSIPATFIGFDMKVSCFPPSSAGYQFGFKQISGLAGYGVNAGGTSLSPNNQNFDWYTNNQEGGGINNPLGVSFDGGNRRFVWGFGSTDYNVTGACYFRVTCRYISYVTITFA